MKTSANDRAQREGAAIGAAIILTAIASLTIGSTMYALGTYMRNTEQSYDRDRAFFLADAGVAAAVTRLNHSGVGSISYTNSRALFSMTDHFDAPNWGFQTQLQTTTNGATVVVSTGRYYDEEVEIKAQVSLGAGSRSIHALYAHSIYAGNDSGDTNYVLDIGGTGNGADFVNGDVYSGRDIAVSGDAALRLPEIMNDVNGDGVWSTNETWQESMISQVFTTGLTQAEFDAYVEAMNPLMDQTYGDGQFNRGEAFADTYGNGIYDPGEPFTDMDGDGEYDYGDEFTDLNGNHVWDPGEPFEDNGNGVWDPGEEWVEDEIHRDGSDRVRVNGRYDPAGGYWERVTVWWWSKWYWRTPAWAADWPAEDFEDEGDGIYVPGEPYQDMNGVFDPGYEEFLDDRNGIYDYGVQAVGSITGMQSPGIGQRAATGYDAPISPPDLLHMYYDVHHSEPEPVNALARWGHDVTVTQSDYSGAEAITNPNNPRHIFLCNPPRSGSSYTWSNGAKIYTRDYNKVYDDDGDPKTDFFLEDPVDPTFNSYDMDDSIDGTVYTAPMYIDIKPQENVKVYYLDGNLYIHSPRVYSMRFREPGTRVTFVVNGNITISDEFYYNADYDPNLEREDMDSTVVNNPLDALCMIALKDPNCEDSGNIYIGDRQYGTGGSIHSMLYAEGDFIDNNLNTSDQAFISIYGNMSAGNQVALNRNGNRRTRLDVTIDERIMEGTIVVPGLPHPVGMDRSIAIDTEWHLVPGSWETWVRY